MLIYNLWKFTTTTATATAAATAAATATTTAIIKIPAAVTELVELGPRVQGRDFCTRLSQTNNTKDYICHFLYPVAWHYQGRARTGWLSVTIMYRSGIAGHGAVSLVSLWDSTMNSP